MSDTKHSRFREVRTGFITQWGTLGSAWGINRTMAQIHALLMVSPEPLETEAVMTELSISRGNANTNLRDLAGWGLISKVTYPGDRKEYFKAEKDVWKIFCIVARERKRREIEPAMRVLTQCVEDMGKPKTEEEQAFLQQLTSLNHFVSMAAGLMDQVAASEEKKTIPRLLKLFK